MAFGSDWPVVKAEPLLGMFAAAFRRAPGESKGHAPDEAVSLREALQASTVGAAALVGLENETGSLRYCTPGHSKMQGDGMQGGITQ